jgi:cytochrome bd-type quinol oxidase subunit 2
MDALRLQRVPVGSLFVLASLLVLVGFAVSSRLDDINATPLFWMTIFSCAPLVSVGCVILMWRQRMRPRWLTGLATLLALPQCIGFYVTAHWMLHYIGILK